MTIKEYASFSESGVRLIPTGSQIRIRHVAHLALECDKPGSARLQPAPRARLEPGAPGDSVHLTRVSEEGSRPLSLVELLRKKASVAPIIATVFGAKKTSSGWRERQMSCAGSVHTRSIYFREPQARSYTVQAISNSAAICSYFSSAPELSSSSACLKAAVSSALSFSSRISSASLNSSLSSVSMCVTIRSM